MAILTAQTFTIAAGTAPLDPIDGQVVVTMDEGNSPWLTATAIVQRPNDATMAALDPSRVTPVIVKLTGPVALQMTFRVQGRTYDPDADAVALVLVSDEYPLLTYAPSATVDLRAATYQGSVRNIATAVVTTALGRSVTVQLAAGTANAAFPTFAAAENIFPDPSVTVISRWDAASSPAGKYSIAQDTSYGVNAVRATSVGQVAWLQVLNTVVVPATPGQKYTASVLPYYAGNGPVTGTMFLQFKDGAGTTLREYSVGLGSLPFGATNAVRRGITATAPLGTEQIRTIVRGSGTASLYAVAAAQWSVVEGDGFDTDGTTYTWFSGDIASGTSGYTYAWTGAPNASSSTRTPLVERDPSSLLWTPLETADAFLRPILEATGMRLFQNEAGAFVLANNGYRVPGQVVMQQGSTLYEASESTSVMDTDADGYPLNVDAVIVTYAWTDLLGREQTATDVAKATTNYSRPYVLQKTNTPYPGPGQARFLLTRLLARTRKIATAGRPDWTARPGMAAAVSLPNRPTASGYVQALEFDLGRAVMTVTTKNLVTTPPGSIGNAPPAQTIGAVSGTIAAYTN